MTPDEAILRLVATLRPELEKPARTLLPLAKEIGRAVDGAVRSLLAPKFPPLILDDSTEVEVLDEKGRVIGRWPR